MEEKKTEEFKVTVSKEYLDVLYDYDELPEDKQSKVRSYIGYLKTEKEDDAAER